MIIKNTNIIAIDNSTGTKMYRVLFSKYDPEAGKWAFSQEDVNEELLIRAIMAGKVTVHNVEVHNRKIRGVYASLDRFIPDKGMAIKPIVILSELRTADSRDRLLGYKFANADGKIKNGKLEEILSYCSRLVNQAKRTGCNAVPIQNAIFVPATESAAAHIKPYTKDDFQIERIKVNEPAKAAENKVDASHNRKQLSRLEELFSKEQIEQLVLGRNHNVNYKIYGNNKLSAEQMKELRLAMEDGVNPKSFADPAFKPDAIKAYRIQAKYGVNLDSIVDPEYNSSQIFELSTGLVSGIDISKMADPKKSADDMAKIRIELESQLWKEFDVSIISILEDFAEKK